MDQLMFQRVLYIVSSSVILWFLGLVYMRFLDKVNSVNQGYDCCAYSYLTALYHNNLLSFQNRNMEIQLFINHPFHCSMPASASNYTDISTVAESLCAASCFLFLGESKKPTMLICAMFSPVLIWYGLRSSSICLFEHEAGWRTVNIS